MAMKHGDGQGASVIAVFDKFVIQHHPILPSPFPIPFWSS